MDETDCQTISLQSYVMHSKSLCLFWSLKNIRSILSGTDKDRRTGTTPLPLTMPRDNRAEPMLFLGLLTSYTDEC